jgi:serine/threonine-protein kinase
VLVGRRREVEARITLLEDGTTPPGFVFVPPGPFIYGGDPRVFQPAPAEIVESPGFFLARRELTNQEWFEFVNDEETLAIIEAASERKILPREPGGLIARRRTEGRGYDWGPSLADTPVLGISWNDAQEFLRWKNRKASEAGERWIYDLPTQKEWEKAARGADGRPFPWGERFDFSLTLGAYRKKGYLLDAPVGFEPRDESPYGLLDMGGSRQEWTKDLSSAPADAQAIYHIRGGAWGQAGESTFRSAGRGYAIADATTGYTGLRLVARPR